MKENNVVTSETKDALSFGSKSPVLSYQCDMETMTVYQKNFLIAVANGINSGLSRREVLNEYHLESSANVQGVKKALIARDFILPSNQLILYLNHPILQQGLLPCACQL